VYVRHATELYMQGPEEVMEVMRAGSERRSVASTNMNDISSRSHSVFLMEITQKDTIKGGVKTGKLYVQLGNRLILHGGISGVACSVVGIWICILHACVYMCVCVCMYVCVCVCVSCMYVCV